jgi:hypothetical protein
MNNPENIKTHIRQFIICKFECKSFIYKYISLSANSKNVGDRNQKINNLNI